MSARRNAIQQSAATEDSDAPPILEREVKQELIDADELQDSAVSQNLMNQLMQRLNGNGSDESAVEADDPFPKDFGVKNLALQSTATTQAKLFGTPPPLHSTLSRNSRGPIKAPQATSYVPDRRYTLGPVKPKLPRANQRANVVGTNTKLGPRRILAQRDREFRGYPYKKVSMLEAYNGGRPGERFKPMSESEISGFFDRMASTSSAKKSSSTDVQRMLQEQPSVRMEVSMGAGVLEAEQKKMTPKAIPKKLRLARTPKKAEVQKEEELKTPKEEEASTSGTTSEAKMDQTKNLPAEVRNVADHLEKYQNNQDVLMSSMVLNTLTNLKARNNDEHAQFSAEIFGLMLKYGSQ